METDQHKQADELYLKQLSLSQATNGMTLQEVQEHISDSDGPGCMTYDDHHLYYADEGSCLRCGK